LLHARHRADEIRGRQPAAGAVRNRSAGGDGRTLGAFVAAAARATGCGCAAVV
jgi:hypothetical protein